MEKDLSTSEVLRIVKMLLNKYRPRVEGKKQRIYLDILINNQLVLLVDVLKRMEKEEKD